MVKLSKTAWLAILIGLLVMAFAALGMTYSQHSRQQTNLNQQLNQAQLLLKKTGSNFAAEKRDLQDSTVKAKAELDAMKLTLSPGNESIETSDALFRIAAVSQVRIVDITSGAPAPDRIGGTPLSALSLVVRLQGQRSNILNFISTWTEQHVTGVVKSVAMTRSQDAPSDNVTARVTDNVTPSDNVTGRVTDNVTPIGNVTDNVTPPPEPSLEPGKLTASISLAIYTYKGK